MTDYVVGFLTDGFRVALVRKNRPDWQAGLLNGVGGKIGDDESPHAAMRREFLEEAGLDIEQWEAFLLLRDRGRLSVPGAAVWIFRARVAAKVLDQVRTCTDETIEVWRIVDLLKPGQPIVPNLYWMAPLAAYTYDRYAPMTAVEVSA